MTTRRAAVVAALATAVQFTLIGSASGQAWLPRARQGSVTFVAQDVRHIGRVFGPVWVRCCDTTNASIDVDVEYGITNRLAVSAGLPFVFAKYLGEAPDGPAAFLPYVAGDKCHCLHHGFQDIQFAARYNLVRVGHTFALTPSVSFGAPTHGYDYVGEAVVGFGLKELRVGVDAGQRFDAVVPGLSVEGEYQYAVVQRVLGIAHNRSNGRLELSYEFWRGLTAYWLLSWQHTHGGLRFPEDVQPFPERWTEFHRLLRDGYVQMGAGASIAVGNWQIAASFLRTVRGMFTHDVRVYTLSAGRSFRIRR
jgi:hypothetical protein